jgi:hypothetical protein
MPGNDRWRAVALLTVVALLPLLVNHDAYRGYFADDDFGSINWARFVPPKDFIADLPCLAYPCQHIRPTGFFYYAVMIRAARFDFPLWIFPIQAVGVINILLLWLLLRKIGFGDIETATGCLMFGLSHALFDGWWKPMFIYDVLCTTFALAALLAYSHRQWVISFIAFWLAMRTKEIGIVIPAVLLCYEMILGERKWKRVLPFFIPAVIYGGYGILWNRSQPHSPYSLTSAPAALWKSISFYSTRLFQIRYVGFLLPVSLLLVRDRRLYFGIAAMTVELGIYFLLPDRMLEVYLYLAMTGAAIAVSALVSTPRRLGVILVLGWAVWQITLTRKHARVELAEADERRQFAAAVREVPPAPVYLYYNAPASLNYSGGEYLIRDFHDPLDDVLRLDAPALPGNKTFPLLLWDTKTRQLSQFTLTPDSYVNVARSVALAPWQTPAPWPADSDGLRAVRRWCAVHLYQPAGADSFHLESCGTPEYDLRGWLDGEQLFQIKFSEPGCETQILPVKPGLGRVVTLDMLADPRGQTKVGSFGFAPLDRPGGH